MGWELGGPVRMNSILPINWDFIGDAGGVGLVEPTPPASPGVLLLNVGSHPIVVHVL